MSPFHSASRHPLESLTTYRDAQPSLASRSPRDQCGPCPEPEVAPSPSFADLLQPQDIVLDLPVLNKPELLQAIGQHMARVHGCNADWVTKNLARREMAGSTGIGQGFAIPHARVLDIDQIQVAYLRLQSPIDFDASDDLPVSDVVVLLVPKLAAQQHLSILADTSRMFVDSVFRAHLKQARTAQDVQQLVKGCKS